ncbi:hypothetical protein FNB15_04825 [Ferrovibrio terrae]|uniref:PAS domain-containing protein n=1 Tax=Ferrovibrio terrae TaxID=2594003 RepID=A0A516GYN2_9PROT|nr:hypothetical protein [Ferrovibrio terrae]QDO96641.1 hypothetical protein FNB15_04825 [Ferrovibrio terrae]
MTLDDNPVLRAAHDFWCSLRQTSGIPDIRQLDAATIPRTVLPHLIVAQTTQGDFDLSRLRLAGAEITRWFRELPEGMDAAAYGSLTNQAYMQHMRDLLAELIRHRRPVYCRSTYKLPGLTTGDPPNIITCNRLALPMADRGDDVGCVMLAATLTASDFRAGPLRMLPPEPDTDVRHDPFELLV